MKPGATTTDQDPPATALSKRQLKKLAKKARHEATREEFKAKKKQERLQKKQRQRELRELGVAVAKRKPKLASQESSGVHVVIDLSFAQLMTEKEINSTVSQVGYCYSKSKAMPRKIDLTCTSITGVIKETFAAKQSDYTRWKMGQFEKHFSELSPHDLGREDPLTFCYLTADSENEIDTLDPSVVYIIGGIVDKNRHKGLCYQEALKYNTSHARLPIGKYIDMASRKVLTINH
ncbi:tRNA (guanine(9)-N(1))-methyltransferase, partial [Kappamyces sp. JEL0680]